ncbi:MAG TPA: hypothetical protein DEP60_10270 [Ruminococcaceae bacterium]|nr:hypothetical protein [Oscillospiraceae bacterium]
MLDGVFFVSRTSLVMDKVTTSRAVMATAHTNITVFSFFIEHHLRCSLCILWKNIHFFIYTQQKLQKGEAEDSDL